MKTGYKRLLIFMLILIVILVTNTFFINFLSGYKMILFLFALLLFFKYYFITEKDRHIYLKDVLFELFLYVCIFFILYYLLGLIIGLARTSNYYTIGGLKNFIIPITLHIILREILRYNLLCKADGNKLCTILVVIVILLFDVTDDLFYANFNTSHGILALVSLSLLPAISKNISFSFISKKVGYKPNILFDLVFSLYPYLIPLIPNPSEYLSSIINMIIPIIFAFRISRLFELKKLGRINSDYRKGNVIGLMIPTVIIVILVYFSSGYFRFYTLAIASGSMNPNIKKGDVVVVDKKKIDYNPGDVIAFRHNDVIVVHRIIKKLDYEGRPIFYTKGDANSHIDDVVVEEDMIVGKANFIIPFIGYPTVWLNE